jgi:hypothetical protein
MASLFLCLLALPAPAPLPDAGAVPVPLIQSVDLDPGALLADPSPLADDTLVLVVANRREAFFKLSERGTVLAAGKLLPGNNPLRFTRPGLADGSQSLFFLLDLLEPGSTGQKFLRVQVTVDGKTGMEPVENAPLSGSFLLEMYHSGRLFGFRKKRMADLLKLKTGPVVPVPDPGISGSAAYRQPAGQSLSVLGLGMALAKFLAGKKAEKRARAREVESQKKRLATTIRRGGRDVPIVIELRAE